MNERIKTAIFTMVVFAAGASGLYAVYVGIREQRACTAACAPRVADIRVGRCYCSTPGGGWVSP